MNQQPLFPIDVKQLIPNSTGSVDMRFFAIGDDGHEYAAKESLPTNPTLPAAEYLGYCFAAACRVAVPVSAQLKMPDGTIALGSRIEGAVAGCTSLMPNDQKDALAQCAPELTALLALDVFLANDDRHGGNFLHRKGPQTGKWTMIAIDFSRAMWCGGFPTTPTVDTVTNGNTALSIDVMKRSGLWDGMRLALTTTSLGAITGPQYRAWIKAMPPAWALQPVIDSIKWWESPYRTQRIADVLNCL